jgi:ABC-type dipeptide/oligopeptide/nickel transport system ATPase component
MKPLSHARSVAVCICAAALMATTASACSSGHSAGTSGSTGSGGTLTIQGDTGNPSLVEDFNPFTPTTELHGAFLIYEPMEIPSPVNGTYTPFLATGYKFTSPTTLVYTIRPDVKWSDGTAFTPADVVFTFNMLKKYPALDTTGIWAQISGVSASGNDVTFTFKAPDVPFAGTIAQVPIVPVEYTVMRPVQNFLGLSAAQARERVAELLETVGLTPASQFAPKLPHQLSGGQRQRVLIARALGSDPELIVADEPVSMLDVSLRAGVLKLLAELRRQRGLSLLYITHDLLSARLVTDEILVLNSGRVVERGPTKQVLQHPQHGYTIQLLDAVANPFAAAGTGSPANGRGK